MEVATSIGGTRVEMTRFVPHTKLASLVHPDLESMNNTMTPVTHAG